MTRARDHVIDDIRFSEPLYVVCSCAWKGRAANPEKLDERWREHKRAPGRTRMTTDPSRWSHKDGSTGHEIDPHYNGNGLPDFWTCHTKVGKATCGLPALLDGTTVPKTVPVPKKGKAG